VAETVKKGQRITGADRAKLAGELTKTSADGASTLEQGDQDSSLSVLEEPTTGDSAEQSDAAGH
jgi:hypothetical protein